eukprot:15129845-Alexandrium_andersonii.AAC.1
MLAQRDTTRNMATKPQGGAGPGWRKPRAESGAPAQRRGAPAPGGTKARRKIATPEHGVAGSG